MIELKQVTIETRHSILQKVDYTFQDGCIYGIVAINGSGKTTLFRTMMNLLRAKEGSILFDYEPIEKKLQQVFYYETIEWLDKNLSGIDYLKFVKETWNSKLKISNVIDEWKMEDYINLPIKKYSLGMKQRLVIAMYLVSDAKYFIMDEITNGLDEENRNHFFQQLQNLKQNGKTILLSSHYKDEIISACDNVLEIKDCQLREVRS